MAAFGYCRRKVSLAGAPGFSLRTAANSLCNKGRIQYALRLAPQGCRNVHAESPVQLPCCPHVESGPPGVLQPLPRHTESRTTQLHHSSQGPRRVASHRARHPLQEGAASLPPTPQSRPAPLPMPAPSALDHPSGPGCNVSDERKGCLSVSSIPRGTRRGVSASLGAARLGFLKVLERTYLRASPIGRNCFIPLGDTFYQTKKVLMESGVLGQLGMKRGGPEGFFLGQPPGRPSASRARTSTSSPTRAIAGALINTARNRLAPSGMISRSSSKLFTCRPKAFRTAWMFISPIGTGGFSVSSCAIMISPAHVPQIGTPLLAISLMGSLRPYRSISRLKVVLSPPGMISASDASQVPRLSYFYRIRIQTFQDGYVLRKIPLYRLDSNFQGSRCRSQNL